MDHVEEAAKHEYREGVSPHRAAEELALYFRDSAPTMKRLLDDLVSEYNAQYTNMKQQINALRERLDGATLNS